MPVGATSAPVATPTPVYRFYKTDGYHFFTNNEAEKTRVQTTASDTYHYEGIAFVSNPTQVVETTPVYRFYNYRQGVHFYTANEDEYQTVLTTASSNYRYEGIAYYADATPITDSTPVFRFYKVRQGVHFYTTNATEAQVLRTTATSTYREEGTAYNLPTTITFTGNYHSDPFVLPHGLVVARLSNETPTTAGVRAVKENDESFLFEVGATEVRDPGIRTNSYAFYASSAAVEVEVRTGGDWSFTLSFPRSSSNIFGTFAGSTSQASGLFRVDSATTTIRYSRDPSTTYLDSYVVNTSGQVVAYVTWFESGSPRAIPTSGWVISRPEIISCK